MLTIQVCVGSSCFLRGSKKVIAEIEQLIKHYKLEDLVTLKGNFCLERCNEGSTVMIGDKIFTGVSIDNVTGLFEKEVFAVLYGVEKT
ncbi:NADH dehydrogenase subunit E [Pelotomaculum schinkii]|uniref:NADH dehydrogenase subunit E n=1 Tax=Pelotomaculum schinkii TaxID=78350 RepID=A0A4Y7RHM5_9FIRM|nr:(2Fe-2S) ferredoxin domain-containing protein [Pelotomaculum schinkii]TEB08505.1 NADH dehydrogenase subunit E [Pelotomaculum schinkii]